jgi:DNA-binding NarL/FixJ family response regulator
VTEPRPSAPLRVLLVDDDPDQRLVVRRLLARAGIDDVAEAADGTAGVQAAADLQPELILLDLVMPGRTGIEVLPDLRGAAPDARTVVLSNLPRKRLLGSVTQAGAVGYVEKRTPSDRLVREVMLAAALLDAASWSSSFPADRSSPRSARRLVRDALGEEDTELLSVAELLVSELVSNVITHAAGLPRVDIRLSAPAVRVEVYDDDATPPVVRQTTTEDVGGRGMLLVARLASRWGSEPHGQGKVVWFELDRWG